MTNDIPPSAAPVRSFGTRVGGPPPPPKVKTRPPGKPARRRGKRLNAIIAGVAVALIAGLGAIAFWLFHDMPSIPDQKHLWAMAREPGITFEDVNGAVIATRGARNGHKVTIGELPAYAPRAFLAAEDRRFYQHGPVEVRSILRALFRNARTDAPDQGGSTLTQQIAKTLFLSPERAVKRKLQEAFIAWRLESRMTKDEVLELYLNRIFFGERSYGLDAASVQYFGHSATTLSVGEAALLASLPKAPSRLSPTRNMPQALERSSLVLSIMRQEGWISSAQEQAAISAPPVLVPPRTGDQNFGYVLDLAASEATAIAGENAPDLIVRLTIDPDLQTKAQSIVAETIAREGRGVNASQAALIAMTPDGAIRAIVGGVDHDESPFNRATQARRQPGSSFKPIVYAAALERGVSPQDVLIDKPIRIGGWRPANYGGGYSGAVTVQRALAESINTIAVQLAQRAGSERLGEISRRFGLTTIPAAPNLSVSLGAYEVSLREITNAFQVFQDCGERRPSFLITSITSSSGELVWQHTVTAGAPAYDPRLAGQMVRMMEGVIQNGTGRHADLGRPAAGKTGTSQDWRDAWFVGFTPDWAAGVWVGNDDNSQMARVTGGSLPAEIWRRFMIEAHKGVPPHDFDFLPVETAPAPADETPDPEDVAGEVEAVPATDAKPAPSKPDDRSSFYGSLADDFERESR